MHEFEMRNGVPQCTLEHYETLFADRHLLHRLVSKWAREKPQALAIINAETGEEVTWERFDQVTTALALKLLELGFRKGDYFATSLPLLTEHIFLEYACFKIGVIVSPLDLRLKALEVIRSIHLIRAKGFAFLGKTHVADFGELGQAVKEHCPSVNHLIQFATPEACIPGSIPAHTFAHEAEVLARQAFQVPDNSWILRLYRDVAASADENDGALVIFTTGSTGYPKPALLSHRNITCQNMCLMAAFGIYENERMLVNLPPSHVGCQTEQLMTAFFGGATNVILPMFDPEKTLQAIETHKVTCFGQIPALFNLEWRLPTYDDYDLSSLKFALYGGQQVSRQFLEKLATMAKGFGTGLGLTETAGFCTYTPLDGTVEDILAGVGYDMPVYPMSIRAPMQADGSAGEELPRGETGHICFRGPQSFLGYVNEPEATARTLSSDGWLYTGDLGFVDEKGLHFAARAKHVIKPKGYQVFPSQVEDHFCSLRDKVVNCGVVGVSHEIYSEAIVAFVEKKPDASLDEAELKAHARSLAAYMRPSHYVIVETGRFPLNRVAKTDYMVLKELAEREVDRLRVEGRWDR